MQFFRQFKDHNSGREHENYTNDPIFSFYFFYCLEHSFLNFKILKIHFQIHYFGQFWSLKYLNFSPKATDSDSSSYFSRKYTLRLLKIFISYVLSTRQSQIPIILGSRSWTILEVEESVCFFITF